MTWHGGEESNGHWSAGLADWDEYPDASLVVDPRWLTPEYLGGVIADALLECLDGDGFESWFKYSEDEPRDELGRWTNKPGEAPEKHGAERYGPQTDPAFHELVHGDENGRRKRVSAEALEAFNKQVDKLPGVTPEEAHTYQRIFAVEGGMKKDGATVAGITQRSMDDIKEAMRSGKLPRDHSILALRHPKDMSLEQVPARNRDHLAVTFRDPPDGIKTLWELHDGKTVAAIADVVFREGPNGVKYANQSVNEAMGRLTSNERERVNLKPVKENGHLWPSTVQAIRQLSRVGMAGAIRRGIAHRRTNGDYGDETTRIHLFDN